MSMPSRLRATKIICTIGPATDTSDMLGSLIQAGANVFRLNMSHSKHDWVREVVFRIRPEGRGTPGKRSRSLRPPGAVHPHRRPSGTL